MKNTFLGIVVVASWASGCVGTDADIGVVTETITAEDLSGGQRPLVDPTRHVRWVVDGTGAPIDLERIDVRTGARTVTLRDYVADAFQIDAGFAHELSGARLLIDSPETMDAVGVHEEALISNCRCSDSNGSICVCDWDGDMCDFEDGWFCP